MDKAGDHGLEVVAPVVAPGEAGEVALGMVGAELAVGPGDRALDVAERRVDPFERGHTSSLGSRAGAHRAMAAGALAEHTPTAEAVGDDRASRRQPMRRATCDLALAEALDRRQLELARTPPAPVETAATKGVLPAAPRPRLPPERLPPR